MLEKAGNDKRTSLSLFTRTLHKGSSSAIKTAKISLVGSLVPSKLCLVTLLKYFGLRLLEFSSFDPKSRHRKWEGGRVGEELGGQGSYLHLFSS
jgi:hypothetical protein